MENYAQCFQKNEALVLRWWLFLTFLCR